MRIVAYIERIVTLSRSKRSYSEYLLFVHTNIDEVLMRLTVFVRAPSPQLNRTTEATSIKLPHWPPSLAFLPGLLNPQVAAEHELSDSFSDSVMAVFVQTIAISDLGAR